MAGGRVTVGRRLVPRVDEPRALAERVLAPRLELEHQPRLCACGPSGRQRKGRPRRRPAGEILETYASLIRFARGPFWLGSISNETRSPPASESKLTLESRPVRWKKYSLPSSAAMKPNPRSETSFLMVPVGIVETPLLESKPRTHGSFEKSDHGDRPPTPGTDLPYHPITRPAAQRPQASRRLRKASPRRGRAHANATHPTPRRRRWRSRAPARRRPA